MLAVSAARKAAQHIGEFVDRLLSALFIHVFLEEALGLVLGFLYLRGIIEKIGKAFLCFFGGLVHLAFVRCRHTVLSSALVTPCWGFTNRIVVEPGAPDRSIDLLCTGLGPKNIRCSRGYHAR